MFALTIDSEPLDGVRTISVEESAAARTKMVTTTSVERQLDGARILVVDDGDSNRTLINLVLTFAGASVETACNGREAVERVEQRGFDLIMMDMRMPVMDGCTASRILRERGFESPIIALTADAMKGSEATCFEAGCTDFLAKPIDMDKLVLAVGRVLRGAGHTCLSPCSATDPDACNSQRTRGPIHSTLPTDDADYREIIVEFESRLREKVSGMRDAMRDHDYEELAVLAHWLKGSGGTAGFGCFTKVAEELQLLARNHATDEEIALVMNQIEEMSESVVAPQIQTA
ncbi:MAG: response regulator [Planctomycetota bacterium]